MFGIHALVLTFFASTVDAHGYVTISRAKKCNEALNSNCGAVQYEPQSVEGPQGYPSRGPPDGQLASAGLTQFATLNQQSSTRWHKTAVSPGSRTFTWQFTANHPTRDYEYYITRAGWNQNAPLTRSSFEAAPFCYVTWDGSRPPTTHSHSCTLPSRTGYHVVMAVWDVSDTAAAFYNMIDVDFGGSSSTTTATTTTTAGTCSDTRCGSDWSNAFNNCNTPCASWPNPGWDACPSGQSCFANLRTDLSCCSGTSTSGSTGTLTSGSTTTTTTTAGTCSDTRCGSDWSNAYNNCNTPCASWPNPGWDACPSGQSCFANLRTDLSCCSGTSTILISGGTGTCGGGIVGDGRCPDGRCCSQYGYCGTSSAHCGGRRLGSSNNSTISSSS